MSIPDIEGFDPAWFQPADNQTEYTKGFYSGQIHQRQRIIDEIERNICSEAQADANGHCSNHGGKCYELRQLIKKLSH